MFLFETLVTHVIL
jgi:hypothetical protein